MGDDTAVRRTENRYSFYVSARGDDSWSGTLPALNGATDGPFATLSRARDAIRQIKTDGRFDRPATVMVLDGTLHLTEPLVLGSGDSGTHDHPITYTAYPGDRPVLSGGVQLTGWRPYEGEIMQCRLPTVKHGRWSFRQLFFEDRRQVRARWPKRDPEDPLYGGWAFIEATLPEAHESPTTFRYESDVPVKPWAKPHLAEVNIFPWKCWLNDITPVKGVDPEKRTISLTREAHHSKHKLTQGNRFIVENVLEELDQPGEWCLDPETQTVYFWPPTSPLESAEVVVPLTDRLIELRGTPDRPIRHITISGLTFAHTLSPFPDHQHPETFHSPGLRGGTVHLENAEDCRVENNLFQAVGADGIRLEGYNARNHIVGNEIADAGAAGVSVTSNGPQNTVTWMDREVIAERTGQYATFVRNVISNNYIHHGGAIKKRCGAIQVFAMNSVDNIMSHNLIHDMSDKGFMIKDGFGRITIEFNDIFRLGLEVADTGAIMSESWFTIEEDDELSRGNIIRYNRIRDVLGCAAYGTPQRPEYVQATRAGGRIWMPYFTWGIYFDNTGMDITVFGNLVMGTVLGGVSLPVGNPKNIVIENNILVDHRARQADLQIGHGWTEGKGATGNRFVRNVISSTDPESAILNVNSMTGEAFAECDYNLYSPVEGQEPIVTGAPNDSYDRWRDMGFDTHSIIADPCFVDAAGGDYRLRPESPAFKLGFQPIDFDSIGLERPAGPAHVDTTGAR